MARLQLVCGLLLLVVGTAVSLPFHNAFKFPASHHRSSKSGDDASSSYSHARSARSVAEVKLPAFRPDVVVAEDGSGNFKSIQVRNRDGVETMKRLPPKDGVRRALPRLHSIFVSPHTCRSFGTRRNPRPSLNLPLNRLCCPSPRHPPPAHAGCHQRPPRLHPHSPQVARVRQGRLVRRAGHHSREQGEKRTI